MRLILPRDEHAEGDRYARAAGDVRRVVRDGRARPPTPTPRFYAYRMEFRDPHGDRRHTRGVIGALTLPEPGDDDVLPHERTLPKAKSDRLALLRATRVNVDPIWGLTLAPGLTALLEPATPLAACVDADGVVHELGAIDDPAADRRDPARSSAARRSCSPTATTASRPRATTATSCAPRATPLGGAGAIMTFVVELVDDELDIEPIHRLLDLPAGVDLRARLADAFDVVDAGANTPDGVDALEARDGRRARARARRRRRPRARGPARRRCGPPRSPASTRRSPRPTPPSSKRWSCPALAERDVALLARRARRRRAGRQGRRDRGDPVLPGVGRAARAPRPSTGCACRRRRRSSAPKPRTGMVFRTLD